MTRTIRSLLWLVLAGPIPLGLAPASGAVDSAAWLRVPVSARAVGLGGAFAAVADDASAVTTNPAGIAQGGVAVHRGLWDASFAALASDRRLASAAGTGSAGRLQWGAAVLYATVPEVPSTDADGRSRGSSAWQAGRLTLAAARRIRPGLSAGLSLHALHERFGRYAALGAGLDAGVHWQVSPARPAFVALALSDVGSYLSWNTSRLGLAAPAARLGASHFFRGDRLLAAFEAELAGVSRLRAALRAGVELSVAPRVRIRGGVDSTNRSLSAGIGFVVRAHGVDYAVSRAFSAAGASTDHRIQLTGRY